MILKGSILREQMNKRKLEVNSEPGLYFWWFPADIAKSLLDKIGGDFYPKHIQIRNFENGEYWALYVGISKNMHHRITWHIKGPFKKSTLRRTLHGLLDQPSTNSNAIDLILDDCY